jgi:hypothetical protein
MEYSMPSVVSYAWGALMFVSATSTAAVLLKRLWRSDKHEYAKIEESLKIIAVLLIFWAGAVFGFFQGWMDSYPKVVVNGYHRSTAPAGTAELILLATYIPVLMASICFLASWWMKRRRVRLAATDEDRIWAALYSEYGWTEARRLYGNYRRRMDQIADGD